MGVDMPSLTFQVPIIRQSIFQTCMFTHRVKQTDLMNHVVAADTTRKRITIGRGATSAIRQLSYGVVPHSMSWLKDAYKMKAILDRTKRLRQVTRISNHVIVEKT